MTSQPENGAPAPDLPLRDMLIRLFRFQPWLLIQITCLAMLEFGVILTWGMIFRGVFNELAAAAPAIQSVWSLLAIFVAAALVRISARFLSAWQSTRLSFSFASLIHQNLLQIVLNRPGAQALPQSPGEAVSRFTNDVEYGLAGFLTWLPTSIGQLAFGIVAVIILLRINVLITLTLFLPMIGVLILTQAVTRRLVAYREATRTSSANATGFLGEVFGAVQAIQVAHAEQHASEHYNSLNESAFQAALKEGLFNRVRQVIIHNLSDLGTGVVLLLGAQALRDGSLTVGDFALFIYYLDWVTIITNFTGELFTYYRQADVSYRRVLQLTPGEPPQSLVAPRPVMLDREPPPVSPLVRTRVDQLRVLKAVGLSYHYPGTDHGIAGIDLSIARGSFTVITGRIGSGKTTLLRTLLGLLPRDAGEIYWNDLRVENPGAFFLPPRSAYTPQVPRLFSETLRENILAGLPDEDDDVAAGLAAAVRLAVMEQDIAQMEHGLDTIIGPRGVRLSGGQVQRTAAARMFVRQPELLVFDDLSSALDIETEQTLWERLFARDNAPSIDGAPSQAGARELTCLVVSHRRAALRRADHIILLQNGRVLAEGKLDALLESCEEMRLLWRGDPLKSEENR